MLKDAYDQSGSTLSAKLFWLREAGIVLFSLAVIAGAEGLIRHRLVQGHFWVAVLERMDASDWVMREPAQLHYDNLHPDESPAARRGISVFGSSQSAVNLDRQVLAEQLGRPVYRRALAGMLALETCSAQYMLAVPRTGTAVFYMSPMDVAGTTSVRANWMRSLISPQSWRDVVQVLGPDLAWKNRRPLAELAVAAHLRLWAFRDFVRWLIFHLAGRTPAPTQLRPGESTEPPRQQQFVIEPAYVEASFRGYGMVLDNLKRRGFDVVVFQGEVNPVFRRQIADSQWRALEERIKTFLQERQTCYVPLGEYRPGIELRDWADNTHMNVEGRRKLTAAVVSSLQTLATKTAQGRAVILPSE